MRPGRGWQRLADGDLGAYPLQAVGCRMYRVRCGAQRAAEQLLKPRLLWIWPSVRHVARSRTVRSVASAREAWLLTAPQEIPIVCAICASDKSA